ncbi:FtsW/RodA/SpoVE family cell cycle protein [Ravibacter arvi]|uniref:Probable peptidoglycan glycosyltransferase FtsW n=1 Tax=Ravibacter arvi TaxID=2051041 RepID=A0ABP8LV67_9BACT
MSEENKNSKFLSWAWISQNLKGDKYIWAISVIILFLSVPFVYSSSVQEAYRLRDGNTEYYLYKHFAHIVAALLIMFLIHLIPYTKFIKYTRLGVFISIPLLLLAVFAGSSVNDASRWIEIPVVGYRFQPSEFAKIALITHLALVLARHIKGGWTPKELLTEPILLIGAICFLIALSNVSTAALLGAVSFLLLFVGKVPIRYLAFTAAVLIFVASLAVVFKAGTRMGTASSRIKTFMNKDSVAYQSERSYMAMAGGGFFGKGIGKSTERRFLPESNKDFIYAITVEEGGTLIGGILIFLYLALLYRGLQVIKTARKPFGGLLSMGHTIGIVFQALCTMAVTVGLLPVTGQNLPLFSLGGNSMILTALAMGMILSASRGEFDEVNV